MYGHICIFVLMNHKLTESQRLSTGSLVIYIMVFLKYQLIKNKCADKWLGIYW